MKKDLFDNYQLSGLVSMSIEESESITGGYSWDEFKADCASAWNEFKKGVSAGFEAAKQ